MTSSILTAELKKRSRSRHPEQEAYLNMVRTINVLALQMDRLFKQYELSESSYDVLGILRAAAQAAKAAGKRFSGLPCSFVAEEMITQVPDLTRLVDRLCAAGLVTRGRSPEDRRVVLLKLTAKGRRLLDNLDGPVVDLYKSQLGHMTRRDLSDLNRLLLKARNNHTA
jgi:DNA-binding MarR family transcriptional regulator